MKKLFSILALVALFTVGMSQMGYAQDPEGGDSTQQVEPQEEPQEEPQQQPCIQHAAIANLEI